ncbi:MAG: DUF3617 family protein [Rhodopseudomonas sp.]|nr:DUF3617 family protein [Rhodopseudomonas sp.]
MVHRFVAAWAVICAAGFAVPAFAFDMPTRKPGLWELKMEFVGRHLPIREMKHCVDAATDKLMNSSFGGGSQQNCSQQKVNRFGNTTTIDSVCTFNGATVTSHAVVTGSFDDAYTVDVSSTREGGRPIPGLPAKGASHMKIAAKWLGRCQAGQRPGDIIMPNGMTVNVLAMPRLPTSAPH